MRSVMLPIRFPSLRGGLRRGAAARRSARNPALARAAALLASTVWVLAIFLGVPLQAQEQVDVEMPPQIVIDLGMGGGGPTPAREVFPLTFANARLAAGKALRISLLLDSPAPLGFRIAFEGRNPRGGICASGRLSPASFVQVFQSAPGAAAGGCELQWSAEAVGNPRHGGRSVVALRWQLETVAVDPRAAASSLLPPGQSVHGAPPIAGRSSPGRPFPARGRPSAPRPPAPPR
jgi:hypothetical protein